MVDLVKASQSSSTPPMIMGRIIIGLDYGTTGTGMVSSRHNLREHTVLNDHNFSCQCFVP